MIKKRLQVCPRRRICIFHNHQAGTRMLHKHGDGARLHPSPCHGVGYLVSDLVGPLPLSSYGKLL